MFIIKSDDFVLVYKKGNIVIPTIFFYRQLNLKCNKC